MSDVAIAPAMFRVVAKFDLPDSELEKVMGRPGFFDGKVAREIADELQGLFFDLTDYGVELDVTYTMNRERPCYLQYVVTLIHPIYVLDKIDTEEYALKVGQQELPFGLIPAGVKTTNELDWDNGK